MWYTIYETGKKYSLYFRIHFLSLSKAYIGYNLKYSTVHCNRPYTVRNSVSWERDWMATITSISHIFDSSQQTNYDAGPNTHFNSNNGWNLFGALKSFCGHFPIKPKWCNIAIKQMRRWCSHCTLPCSDEVC